MSITKSLEHSDRGAVGLEEGPELGLAGTSKLVGDGELNASIVELLGVGTLAGSERNSGSPNDADLGKANAVPGGHLVVHLGNSTVEGEVTVLLVHVVVTSATLVTNPNAVVLDSVGALLENLVNGKNLAVSLLHPPKLPQEVPELALGLNAVLSPDLHTIDSRSGLLLSGQVATNNLVLVKFEKTLLHHDCD